MALSQNPISENPQNQSDHSESLDADQQDLQAVIKRMAKELEIQNFLAKKYKSDYHVIEQFLEASTKDVQKRNEELLDVNLKLEKFAYVVAHDLKAPLRTINSFSGLLINHLKDTKKEEAQLFIEFIQKACDQMSNLISETLEYSKVKDAKIKYEKVNLNRTFENVIELIPNNSGAPKNEFFVDQLPTVVANKAMMFKLFTNLIQNGLKYNKSEIKQVNVTCEDSETHYIFHFKDNGIGLAGKDQEAIFDMFTRLHSPSEYEGTGIGLAMCKKIVENHKGEISVKSQENEGCVFTCTISKEIKD